VRLGRQKRVFFALNTVLPWALIPFFPLRIPTSEFLNASNINTVRREPRAVRLYPISFNL